MPARVGDSLSSFSHSLSLSSCTLEGDLKQFQFDIVFLTQLLGEEQEQNKHLSLSFVFIPSFHPTCLEALNGESLSVCLEHRERNNSSCISLYTFSSTFPKSLEKSHHSVGMWSRKWKHFKSNIVPDSARKKKNNLNLEYIFQPANLSDHFFPSAL